MVGLISIDRKQSIHSMRINLKESGFNRISFYIRIIRIINRISSKQIIIIKFHDK